MKVFKLTDSRYLSYGGTQWGEGVTHEARGEGTDLCSDGVIHVYKTLVGAGMFNCIHANFPNPVAWATEVEEVVVNDGLKIGAKRVTTLRVVPLPEIPLEKKIEFGIRVVKKVYPEPEWNQWANDWLTGKDRTEWVAWWAAKAAAAEAAAAEAAAAGGMALIDETIAEVFGH